MSVCNYVLMSALFALPFACLLVRLLVANTGFCSSVNLSVYLSVNLPVSSLSTCPSVRLSACLYVCLFVCLSTRLDLTEDEIHCNKINANYLSVSGTQQGAFK